jgi:asparagine synthase (glutamine-hydrolysing)
MSGFVALYHRSGRPIDPSLLERLTRRLSGRGPDGWDTWRQGPIGLGRSLLQTTEEIEAVPGPIAFEGVHLAGDVRLDDRDGLIRRLLSAGWRTNSLSPDVELLLHAYRLWGDKCLQQIAGDFAFAVWDAREKRLFAARDHFGIVPLFYAEAGDVLLVSNSLPCILAHPDVDASLCEEAVADYLAVGLQTERSRTFYSGIKRLEPARMLHASPAGLRVTPYWKETEDFSEIRYRRPAEYVEHFREIFDAAVRDRLRCNRVATHLSGGMDASSIAVTIARQYGPAAAESLRAYTFYFRDLIPDDEGELAKTIAASSGIPLELFEIEPILDREGSVQDHVPPEPAPADISSPAAVLNQRAAAHGRVIFMGFGGDPLFSAGGNHNAGAPAPWYSIRFLRDVLYCYRMHGGRPHLGMRSSVSVRPSPAPDRLLNADFAARSSVDDRRRDWVAAARPARLGMALDPLWTTIFDNADSAFTGLPLKARFPFFDLRLFRYLNCIPLHPWTGRKMLLRLAMRGSLPEAIRRRPKRGLQGNPWLIRWHHYRLQPWMSDLLSLDDLQTYVDPIAARSILLCPEGWDDATFWQFSILWNLARWLRDRSRVREFECPQAAFRH